jgi:hypothetical protein
MIGQERDSLAKRVATLEAKLAEAEALIERAGEGMEESSGWL